MDVLTSQGRHRGSTPRGAALALLLALPALWPLLRPGFLVSDDGTFHVYRITALADAWAHGVLHPRLFPAFGFDYGQAVLNFYAPLAYWPGALMAALGIAPPSAAQLTIALGFLLAALAAYGYARYLWGPAGGVLAAVAFTYFPYHLADAYQRGAIPEFLAFIWLPLILWAYTAAFADGNASHWLGPVSDRARRGSVGDRPQLDMAILRADSHAAIAATAHENGRGCGDEGIVSEMSSPDPLIPAILRAEVGRGPLLWGAWPGPG